MTRRKRTRKRSDAELLRTAKAAATRRQNRLERDRRRDAADAENRRRQP